MNAVDEHRSALEVVSLLRNRMNEIVTDYSDTKLAGVQRVGDPIDGTGFFPGADGLWRGMQPHGAMPDWFPKRPVMFVGHNFDKVKGYERSCIRGIEVINGLTWRKLIEYIANAPLAPQECFFTNALMGLQPTHAVGPLEATAKFKAQCRAFLADQISIVRPRALVTLGNIAVTEVGSLDNGIPRLALMHPNAARRQTYAQKEGERLGRFLSAL